MSATLTPVPFDALPGWTSDDPTPVIEGLVDCATHVETVKPYKTGSLGAETAEYATVFAAARHETISTPDEARRFFEGHFRAFRVDPPDRNCGFVTAYYEPDLSVSSERSDRFRYPIYRRPDDLVDVDDGNRPEGMDESYAFGLASTDGVDFYADRRAIDQGYLDGRGLEIAWADSKADVFFMHIQGAGRLRFEDGSVVRVSYAAKAGHPFTPIGRVLIEWGELDREAATMQGIRRWIADNPDRVDSLLWQNRSYIFFREAPVADPHRGPVAAAKVALRAGRSLAVDRRIHTFATPFFIQADQLTHLDDRPFRRLMLAQDTGTAIVGPSRGDLFLGSGAEAGEKAGSVRHDAVFYVLLPNPAAERLVQ